MKQIIMSVVLLSAMWCMAWAQVGADHAGHGAAAQGEQASGEVRKIDTENSKITIRHGEIKSLNMPPMTMVYQVQNKELLGKVAVGDKVFFRAFEDKGSYVLTEIDRAP